MRGSERVWGPWLLAWLGLWLLAMLNATPRVLVTQPLLGETAARALATLILLAAITAYAAWWHARHPLPSARTGRLVGLAWVAMTLGFELGWGGLVEGLSWSTMLADYDLSRGRLWVLVPVWILLLPSLLHHRSQIHPRARPV